MDSPPLYDLAPIAHVELAGVALATGPLAWVWLRHRGTAPAVRLRALSLLALFLSFDLVLFGTFTRLTDSGLGCPDWPGCYGNASPVGAAAEIHAAQARLPSGPVTPAKAWIEMIHRYLATGVGVLILVLALDSWIEHRRGLRLSTKHRAATGILAPPREAGRRNPAASGAVESAAAVSPWWATATLAWVCAQGAFGALTVTMKLYPAIVTAHLLGGVGMLVLLAAQAQGYVHAPLRLSRGLFAAALAVFVLTIAQTALGGWVSTNYAVLACADFPACQGSWWPAMDFKNAFTLWRELGQTGEGGWLPFEALTAIHQVHRLGAAVVLPAVALLAWRLAAAARAEPAQRRWALLLVGLALWQLATGISTVVFGWPLLAAVAHIAGAAALAGLLTVLLVRAWQAGSEVPPASPAQLRLGAAQ